MDEIDLSKGEGCSDNPIALLLKALNENREEFTVISKKSTLPFELAKLLASKKGYVVELVSEANDVLKIKFKKSATELLHRVM